MPDNRYSTKESTMKACLRSVQRIVPSILLLVLLLTLTTGCGRTDQKGGEPTPTSPKDAGAKATEPQSDVPPADVTITAEALVKDFTTDAAAAENKYKGKEVRITGIVEKIQSDSGVTVVVLKGDGKIPVHCGIPATEVEKVKRYKEGENVTLQSGLPICKLKDMSKLNDVISAAGCVPVY